MGMVLGVVVMHLRWRRRRSSCGLVVLAIGDHRPMAIDPSREVAKIATPARVHESWTVPLGGDALQTGGDGERPLVAATVVVEMAATGGQV
jgi:hypothetical protein